MHAAIFKLFYVAREIPRAWAVGRRICDGSRCHNSFFCGKHAKVSSPFTLYITEAEAAASEREKLFCFPDPPLFTCGRRPTGHVMMAVVVVVVGGGGGGGGEQLLYMGPPRAHVWSIKI